MARMNGTGMSEPWLVCFELLPKVSRTFALSIAGLREPARGAVCVSYLLCRILDTIEDAPGLTAAQRWGLIAPLLERLAEGGRPDGAWFRASEDLLALRSSEADMALMRHTNDVLDCFEACEESARLAMARWVTEMGKGMTAWSERMGEAPGATKTLPTMAALDRYCYYIAGTVGYLLTDLFFVYSDHVDSPLFFRLQADAEAFGLGLQKVNIVKDLGDDYRRGWCFIPTTFMDEAGVSPADFESAAKADAVHRAVLPVLVSAAGHLERAWAYLERFPVEEREIRLFLAYSLFFALETLGLVAKNPAALVSPKKLKISRLDVARLVAELNAVIGRPAALEKFYRKTAAPLEVYLRR